MRKHNRPDLDRVTEYSGDEILIHFDGSCFPNPGGAGSYGFTISTLAEAGYNQSGFIGCSPDMTNNVAEWSGLRAALEFFQGLNGELAGDKILIFGDSQLVIRQLTGRWKVKAKHLGVFRDDCLRLLSEIEIPWDAKWCPRNQNQEADALADGAVRSQTLSLVSQGCM